jgi:hypothetical protein
MPIFLADFTKQSNMHSKEKADELYNNSLKLHGPVKAKKEALNSATATKALAPMIHWDYWDRVVKHINLKEL